VSSPSMDVAAVLVTAGVGVTSNPNPTTGWLIRVGRIIDKPDRIIAIIDTGGLEVNPKWSLDYKTFQVLVRSDQDAYGSAFDKANDIKDALVGIDPFIGASTVRWDAITMLGDVGFLGYDQNSRPIFSANYRCILEPPVSVLSHREAL
jgi:hypothetical protein